MGFLLVCVAATAVNVRVVGRALRAHEFLALHILVGKTHWMSNGDWPEFGYLGRVNELLARDARVLIVAEARTLYLDAPPSQYEYCVVFNRNPFAEAAAERDAAGVMNWLRERDYGYVLVSWTEMRRLRDSRYGFWPSLDEQLFADLNAAGLRVAEQFYFSKGDAKPFATLYEVP